MPKYDKEFESFQKTALKAQVLCDRVWMLLLMLRFGVKYFSVFLLDFPVLIFVHLFQNIFSVDGIVVVYYFDKYLKQEN